MKLSFHDFDLSRMPTKISELRGSPPTAWSQKIEQLLMRSMTFSEYEMISHPIVILNVASSADTDPVRCMQELSFVHHTPSCISSVNNFLVNFDSRDILNHELTIRDNMIQIFIEFTCSYTMSMNLSMLMSD